MSFPQKCKLLEEKVSSVSFSAVMSVFDTSWMLNKYLQEISICWNTISLLFWALYTMKHRVTFSASSNSSGFWVWSLFALLMFFSTLICPKLVFLLEAPYPRGMWLVSFHWSTASPLSMVLPSSGSLFAFCPILSQIPFWNWSLASSHSSLSGGLKLWLAFGIPSFWSLVLIFIQKENYENQIYLPSWTSIHKEIKLGTL